MNFSLLRTKCTTIGTALGLLSADLAMAGLGAVITVLCHIVA